MTEKDNAIFKLPTQSYIMFETEILVGTECFIFVNGQQKIDCNAMTMMIMMTIMILMMMMMMMKTIQEKELHI